MDPTRLGLPPSHELYWSGTDSSTPPGYLAAEVEDPLGNRVTWLLRGDTIDTAVRVGRIVWHASLDPASATNDVYVTARPSGGMWVGVSMPIAEAFQRIIEHVEG